MPNDSLYRISLKCLIKNEAGEILVVKERGRTSWDFPGGGMDHGENLASAIARELEEEIGLAGTFAYNVIGMDEPMQLATRDIWQLRIILELHPKQMIFQTGKDSDEIAFMNPEVFKDSVSPIEQSLYKYAI